MNGQPTVIIRNNIQQADVKWANEAADRLVNELPPVLREAVAPFKDDLRGLAFKIMHKTVRLVVSAEREAFAKLKG